MKRAIAIAVLAAFPASACLRSPLLLLSKKEAEHLRAAVRDQDPRIAPLAKQLRADADFVMKRGPWSVTFHRPAGFIKIEDKHDYFSEAPYWWPDPNNPNGPFIRHDGRVYMERFAENHDDFIDMGNAVLTLGAAAYLFDDAKYGARAAEVARIWFLDEKSRMNPNMEYAQSVRFVSKGRAAGIIDSRPLIWCAQGLTLLDRTGQWKPEQRKAVKKWYRDYTHWLTTSKNGLQEKNAGNNHMTWWTAQVAAYASFTGDRRTMRMAWKHYSKVLIPKEIEADGSCPKEEARTKSLGYSAMNLDAFTLICRTAQLRHKKLWKNPRLAKAVAYLAPYVEDPRKWKKPQIVPFFGAQQYFLALAGFGLKEPKYLELHQRVIQKQKLSGWPLIVQMLVAIQRKD